MTNDSRIYYLGLSLYYSPEAPVAQLDRASDFESEGRRFEPCRVHQYTQHLEERVRLTLARFACRLLRATAENSREIARLGNPGNREVDSGLWLSRGNHSGSPTRVFIGYRNRDTSPAIGETAIISCDRDCGQIQWIYISTYPFNEQV
jgi:hypothetical protein